jgi:hypothetical protein
MVSLRVFVIRGCSMEQMKLTALDGCYWISRKNSNTNKNSNTQRNTLLTSAAQVCGQAWLARSDNACETWLYVERIQSIKLWWKLFTVWFYPTICSGYLPILLAFALSLYVYMSYVCFLLLSLLVLCVIFPNLCSFFSFKKKQTYVCLVNVSPLVKPRLLGQTSK